MTWWILALAIVLVGASPVAWGLIRVHREAAAALSSVEALRQDLAPAADALRSDYDVVRSRLAALQAPYDGH